MTVLTTDILNSLRQRRTAGESVKAMAAEIGLTWQKLDKAIRNGLPGRVRENKLSYGEQHVRAKERLVLKRQLAKLNVAFDRDETNIEILRNLLAQATVTQKPKDVTSSKADSESTSTGSSVPWAVKCLIKAARGTGPIVEKYRPRNLASMVGQERIAAHLQQFAADPFPTAFLFEGETGTGKTSAALALAQALGCDMNQKPPEFGGVHVIASGEQSADAVREIARQMWNSPFSGSGWKVIIVNECDRMALPAETVWLDRLESLPPKTVVVFTTNFAGKLSQRFLDSCTRLEFDADAQHQAEALRTMLAAIWKAECGKAADPKMIDQVVQASVVDGKVSFRRAVQDLTILLRY